MSVLRPLLPRRVLAVFLAALYAVGAFAGIVHVISVEHERCAEHGELIHADASPRPEAPLALYDEARLHAGERAAPHDEHDHCLVLAPSSPAVVGFTHTDVIAALDESALPDVRALPADAHALAEPLFRLAPKQGPPA